MTLLEHDELRRRFAESAGQSYGFSMDRETAERFLDEYDQLQARIDEIRELAVGCSSVEAYRNIVTISRMLKRPSRAPQVGDTVRSKSTANRRTVLDLLDDGATLRLTSDNAPLGINLKASDWEVVE